MKKKDIFLDFTSLLDVTLIVIFFFVIFSHLENVENTTRTNDKVLEMQSAIEKVEETQKKTEKLNEQLQYEVDVLRAADERTASDSEEILEFIRGKNIKLILQVQDGEWLIKVSSKDNVLVNIQEAKDIGKMIKESLAELGYTPEDTILCDFVFRSSDINTREPYMAITNALEELQKVYKYLYYSETDLSVGED